jgi:hypothetical protein
LFLFQNPNRFFRFEVSTCVGPESSETTVEVADGVRSGVGFSYIHGDNVCCLLCCTKCLLLWEEM